MQLSFTKMNGAGNDFIMLDNRDGKLSLDASCIAWLCDRHRGVGADGILAVETASQGADFRMRYYNADGSEAEMCGNGARCFARFARRFGPAKEKLSFETQAGIIRASFPDDEVCVAMSDPHSWRRPATLEINGNLLEVHFINTGVPHAVIFSENVETVDVPRDGAALRNHPAFAPKGTNANFAQVIAQDTIAIRTYERGVEGETLACGTGVCAAALLHHIRSKASSPVHVRVRGGDTLLVGFESSPSGLQNVTLTGPADFVFDGLISL
ncbi:MAG TPA: diaminopimelate epimerase [Terrimicrobiaceae bacterium]|nr:diaminopimelate epimerase [Terrimicrobiaceae bacterium]